MSFDTSVDCASVVAEGADTPVVEKESTAAEGTLVFALTVPLVYLNARDVRGKLYLPEHELDAAEHDPRAALVQATALVKRVASKHGWPLICEPLVAVTRDGLRLEWRLRQPVLASVAGRISNRLLVYFREDSRLRGAYKDAALRGLDPALVHHEDRTGTNEIVSFNKYALAHALWCTVNDTRLHSTRSDVLAFTDQGEEITLRGAPATRGFNKEFTGPPTVKVGVVLISDLSRGHHFTLCEDKTGERLTVAYHESLVDRVVEAHGRKKNVKCELRPIQWTVAGAVRTTGYELGVIHV